MPEQCPYTVVVNVESPVPEAAAQASEGLPILTGVTITHEDPILATLAALGVAASEIPKWKLYTGQVEAKDGITDSRAVVLDIDAIRVAMRKRAEKSGMKHVYDAFKPVTAEAVLFGLAHSVILTNKPRSFWRRPNGEPEPWPLAVATVASVGASAAAFHTEYFGSVAATSSLLIVYGAAIKSSMSSKVTAARLLKETTRTRRNLKHDIEQVLLPIYQ